jgi:hypothetical protein
MEDLYTFFDHVETPHFQDWPSPFEKCNLLLSSNTLFPFPVFAASIQSRSLLDPLGFPDLAQPTEEHDSV